MQHEGVRLVRRNGNPKCRMRARTSQQHGSGLSRERGWSEDSGGAIHPTLRPDPHPAPSRPSLTRKGTPKIAAGRGAEHRDSDEARLEHKACRTVVSGSQQQTSNTQLCQSASCARMLWRLIEAKRFRAQDAFLPEAPTRFSSKASQIEHIAIKEYTRCLPLPAWKTAHYPRFADSGRHPGQNSCCGPFRFRCRGST